MPRVSKNFLPLTVFVFSLLCSSVFSKEPKLRLIPTKQTCHKTLISAGVILPLLIAPGSLYLRFGIKDGALDKAKIQESENYQKTDLNLLTLSKEHQKEVALALAAQIRASSLMPVGAVSEKKLSFYNASHALYGLLKEPLAESVESELTARGFGRQLLKLSSEAELRNQLGVTYDYLKAIPHRFAMNHVFQPWEQIIPSIENKLPKVYLPRPISIPFSWDHFNYELGISPTHATVRDLVDERVAAWILMRLEMLEKRGEKRITPTMIIRSLAWYSYVQAIALHIPEMKENDKYLSYGSAGYWILFNTPKSVFECGALTHFIQNRKRFTSFYETPNFDLDGELTSQIKIDVRDENFWFSSFMDDENEQARMHLASLFSQFTRENAAFYGISYIEAMKGILEELKNYPPKESP